ncbi:MAG: Peptidase C60 sortase A and B [Candidatus Adlerbacteria bacterium GW2011_GWA1_54_10]|uniref:Peptidase C60 sortase A and B n=2 Tax=Candidatus Adleribacteriota TaxID=1752736 RepID=A0A0G1XX45_9BACT|nr:MAG: Peptidase C60 sortase A and B [Candidatus Adlerbacteria bacterium GW2011_GWA1_54_10]KKW37697.1 MAG: Peptidase C60 sortase A and B [Candidatus Adlerbacteria bacterium GW2011_GWB1_54_7]
MSERPLLLQSAKSGVIVKGKSSAWIRRTAVAVGLVAVLVGFADVATRIARRAFGEEVNFFIFGSPASAVESVIAPAPPAATAAGAIVPARLRVPSLGIDAGVEQVGKRGDGAMGIPQDYDDVSWYMFGGKPGGQGNAVFAGHINNSRTRSGVFANLSRIGIGDYIMITDAEGKTLIYVVREIQVVPADNAPAEEVFKTSGPSQVVLITCEGDWMPEERTFDKRLIVIARPAY